MSRVGYKRLLEEIQSFRQQLQSLIECYEQHKIGVKHLVELETDWVQLQQIYRHERNINDPIEERNFTAAKQTMDELFEMTKADRLHELDLDSWRLVEMFLQRGIHYLQAIEQLKPKIGQTKQIYCDELKELLNKDTNNDNLENLKKQWYQLNQYYELLIQDGYCTHNLFEKARSIHKSLYEKEMPATLRNSYVEQLDYYLTEIKDFQLRAEDPKGPFLVDLWTWTLQKLEMLSVFYIIRNVLFQDYTRRNFRFVDSWLLGHTILALIYVCIVGLEWVPIAVKYALLIYGCFRMFEILIYQLNVILVHPYNTMNYSLNSYRRMTIALIHNFVEIIFWFAGTFVTLQFITDSTVPLAVYTSFKHMVTYSMEIDDSKWTVLTILILQFQAAIGVFMTVLSLARFVSLFPQPASMDPKEQEANEVRHAKLMEEICVIKMAVENNRTQIAENAKEIQKQKIKN